VGRGEGIFTAAENFLASGIHHPRIQAGNRGFAAALLSPSVIAGGLHMPFKLLAVAGAAFLLLAAPASADASCCDQHHGQAPCCATHSTTQTPHRGDPGMPCCADTKDVSIVDLLPFQDDPQLNPAPPARQSFDVWFKRPTMVGRSVLQGRFIVEHDNDRMARGEPCTHIYAFDDYNKGDTSKPYATFHCTHLERDRAQTNIVVLESMANGWQRLVEFQFTGEAASHGYPTVR
jgi:hypothetical protein